jgi:hypothetical protein
VTACLFRPSIAKHRSTLVLPGSVWRSRPNHIVDLSLTKKLGISLDLGQGCAYHSSTTRTLRYRRS